MNVLIPNNPENWLVQMIDECNNYPVYLIAEHLNPHSSICIDAGCNVGGFALSVWNNYFKSIMSFDASTYNINEYDKNVGDNLKFESYHYALSSKSGDIIKLMAYTHDGKMTASGNFGTVPFKYEKGNHGWAEHEGFEEVTTISLEDTLELIGVDDVDLLKIDIEGAEHDYLYNKDLSCFKFIVAEIHNFLRFDNKQSEIIEWINKTHDELYSDGDGIDTHFVKLWRRNDVE